MHSKWFSNRKTVLIDFVYFLNSIDKDRYEIFALSQKIRCPAFTHEQTTEKVAEKIADNIFKRTLPQPSQYVLCHIQNTCKVWAVSKSHFYLLSAHPVILYIGYSFVQRIKMLKKFSRTLWVTWTPTSRLTDWSVFLLCWLSTAVD